MLSPNSSHGNIFVLAATLVVALLTLGAAASAPAATAPAATAATPLETATFSMYCYWTGEATLGKVPGVVASRIGHLDGQEIVTVTYDPSQTHVGQLTDALKQQRSFYSLIATSPEEERHARSHLGKSEIKTSQGQAHFIDSKYSLKAVHPDLYYLDLTEQQAIALNSWSYFKGPMPDVLTREQKKRRRLLRAKLSRQKPSGLDPERSRTEDRLQAYRKDLDAWLDR